MKKISVVLPTYNEKENIEKTVEQVLDQEKNLPGYKIDVVVADSDSPDGTGEIVKKLAGKNSHIHLLTVGRGIGVGLIKGHLYALDHIHPDVLVQLDADGQVGFDVLPKLIKTIEEGYDLALGSRFISGGKNDLPFSRKITGLGSSLVSRVLMGPFDIKEFGNSARAFTPQLFRKINLERLPWKEQTYINQPAFLHEAVLAGAKYKEVPLIFKDRAAGYSKNKIVNYTYDVVTYGLDARLHSWGINIPFFQISRKAKTFYKFALVGVTGTIIDFGIYNILIQFAHISPVISKGISSEIAIINNFTFNNIWTFKGRKNNSHIIKKFGTYNLVSVGAIGISVGVIKILQTLYGDGILNLSGIKIAYYNIYFLATIPLVMTWNFTMSHFITWKDKK